MIIICNFIEIKHRLVEELTYASQSTLEVLLGNVIHEREFSKCNVIIYDSRILRFLMKDKELLQTKDLQEIRQWVRSLSDSRYLVLIETGHRTEVEDDIREISASKSGDDFTIADAIVVKSLSQRIIANFYLRFNKPVKPTRIFSEAESAAFWLMSFR
jgi:archaellum biogenesis ATPase FlaH